MEQQGPGQMQTNRQRRRSLQNPRGNPTSATISGDNSRSTVLRSSVTQRNSITQRGQGSPTGQNEATSSYFAQHNNMTRRSSHGSLTFNASEIAYLDEMDRSQGKLDRDDDQSSPAAARGADETMTAAEIAADAVQRGCLMDSADSFGNEDSMKDCDHSNSITLADIDPTSLRRASSDQAHPSASKKPAAEPKVDRRESLQKCSSDSGKPDSRSSIIRKTSLEHAHATFGSGTNVYSRKSSMGSYGRGEGDESAVAYWMPPPTSVVEKTPKGDLISLEADEDKPLKVDFRCACFKLTNISTVDFTTDIKFVVVFEWNDPRLCGMPITTNDLPGDLWGPDIVLENAQNECEVIYDSFSLLDSKTGRLKRTVTFHGPVYNPMSLKDFPFDNDELEMKFISICNWRTLDGSRFGNDPCQRVYTLEPMIKQKGVEFFFLGWGGKVNEFSILGWSHDVQNPPAYEPSKPILFKFDIHLTRKAQFYYLKILLPLWLLVLTSLAPYGIETDDLQGRLEVLVTLLLSTIAFLYIVQESIPKMSHLTVIDKVVITSLISLVMAVLFSFLISILPNPQTLNWILASANQLFYWIANLLLVGPPHYRYKKYIQEMEERQASKELTLSGHLKPGMLLSRRSLHDAKSSRRKKMLAMKKSKSYSLTTNLALQGDHEERPSRMLGFTKRFSNRDKMDVPKHQEESMRKMKAQLENNSGGIDNLSDSDDSDGGDEDGGARKSAIKKKEALSNGSFQSSATSEGRRVSVTFE